MIENISRRPDLKVIAGPCSFDPENTEQYYELAEIRVADEQGRSLPAVCGTRVVPAKSRTFLKPNDKGMGCDAAFIEQAIILQKKGQKTNDVPPSIDFAEKLCKETGLLIASEIMLPGIQLPLYESRLPAGKFMPWNPSVDQLGWHILQMAQFCRENGWYLGIKNGKWLGDISLSEVNQAGFNEESSLERTWKGLASFAQGIDGRLILIQRGVDEAGKGDWRNAPVHAIAARAKRATKAELFYDPSHTNGKKRREQIPDDIIQAMQMKDLSDSWLYDGLLVEVGESITDTDQHLTIPELDNIMQELSKFRGLTPPTPIKQ